MPATRMGLTRNQYEVREADRPDPRAWETPNVAGYNIRKLRLTTTCETPRRGLLCGVLNN